MPADLEVFDVQWVDVELPPPDGVAAFTLPIGGQWRPNDWRIVVACGDLWKATSFVDYETGSPSFKDGWAPAPPPSEWTAIGNRTVTGSSDEGTATIVLAHKLVAGDADVLFSIINPPGAQNGPGQKNYLAWLAPSFSEKPAIFAFTVRGVDPSFTPTCTFPALTSSTGVPASYSLASRSLSNTPGFELVCFGFYGSCATPSTWTDVWNNGFCLTSKVIPSYIAKAMGMIGKKYPSGSSTGTTAFSMPEGVAEPPNGTPPLGGAAGMLYYPLALYFKQAQDVTPSLTAGSAETYTSGSMTATLGTVTNPPMLPGDAETYTSGQMFTPLTGYGITNPYLLTGDPVASSRVNWTTANVTPGRSGVSVSASLDWGRTFTACTNGGPVPGLRRGDTVTGAVLFRVEVWRDDVTLPKPKVYLDPTITLDAGRNELLPLGTFLVKATDVEITDSLPTAGATGAGVTAIGGQSRGRGRAVTLKAVDLSLAIAEHVWEQPYFVRSGTAYDDALRQMVTDRLPGQTRFDIAATTRVCPLLVYGTVQGADPWQDIRELAYAIGWDCWFNPYGVFVARPVVDPALTEPVFTFRQLLGPPVTSIKRSLTRAEVYNHIIVDGAAVSPGTGKAVVPAHGEWRNLDPNHPTYVGGKFGIKPYKVQLPAVTSDEQAVEAATALGIRLREGAETVELTVPPNPTLEPWDVIGLDLADAKLDGNWAILGMDTPGGATRGQRLTVFRQSRQAAA